MKYVRNASTKVVVAAVQMTSNSDLSANLARLAELVHRAAARGAELVFLPENFAFLGPSDQERAAHAELLTNVTPGPILGTLKLLAQETGCWIVGGGMPEQSPEPMKVYNTCVVVDTEGQIAASYRKIHLFDVHLDDGTTCQESRNTLAGGEPVVAETPWGKLGLSVCYDLRFPELYRKLTDLGASFITTPAAFTLHTGKDHWHVLVRARAIENQAFVIAPAQYGHHHGQRVTYGHSLIVDPWGVPLAEAADGEGVILAELDLNRQSELRRNLPCLEHIKL